MRVEGQKFKPKGCRQVERTVKTGPKKSKVGKTKREKSYRKIKGMRTKRTRKAK